MKEHKFNVWQMVAAILFHEYEGRAGHPVQYSQGILEILFETKLTTLGLKGETPRKTLESIIRQKKDVFVVGETTESKSGLEFWLREDFDINAWENKKVKEALKAYREYLSEKVKEREQELFGEKTDFNKKDGILIKSFSIKNFKAFGREQTIPIKPITLIYGANSSGKSSMIHSLLLAKHALDTGDIDIHRTDTGGDSVDLGGFKQYIHRRDASSHMEWTAEIKTSGFKGRMSDLMKKVKILSVSISIGIDVDDLGRPLNGSNPELKTYEVFADGKSLLRMSRRNDKQLKLDQLDYDHFIFQDVIKAIIQASTTTQNLVNSDAQVLKDTIDDLIPEFTAKASRFLPEGFSKKDLFTPDSQMLLFPISREKRNEDLAKAIKLFLPGILDDILSGVFECISGEFEKLQYLGPLRSYPPRHLVFSQHNDPNWYAGGGYAWDVVRKNKKVRDLVNRWLEAEDRLQTKYELVLKEFIDAEDIKERIEEIYDEFLDKMTSPIKSEAYLDSKRLSEEFIRSTARNVLNDLFLVDKKSNTIVSHRDVGIGISQVLPVLVSAYASENKIIAIEQPEIHLHPALQAELADVFIESAIGERKNTFIIETHSEHLLLRIMRRIRETSKLNSKNDNTESYLLSPEDVMVLFVEPTDLSGSIIREMPLNHSGELVKAWPGGFFEEGLREIF